MHLRERPLLPALQAGGLSCSISEPAGLSLRSCRSFPDLFRDGISNNVQHEISAEVGQHRRFEAILPEEIAKGNSNDTVEEDGTPDQQGSELDQRGRGRQMQEAKDH